MDSRHSNQMNQLVLVENDDDDQDETVEHCENHLAPPLEAKPVDMSKVFIPAKEWQEVREDHVVLPGLHYEMNIQTGKKQAKLVEGDDGSSYMASVERLRKTVPLSELGQQDLLFEKMSENNPNDPNRRPRNMQGLLNFCTEMTVREDNTQPTELSHMDPERRRFLEEALSNLTTNVARKLAESIQCLCSEAVTMPGEDITEQEAAIETIGEYVEDLNYASDLHKMGGYPVVVSCLESPHASLRAGAASLIGDICQNMEYCQTQMMQLNILPKLIHMLENDQREKCKVKALYAISCLIRDFPDGEKEFERNDGFSVLMRAMQTGVEKLIVKSVFLLTSLIREYDSGKAENERLRISDTVISMGYIEQLLGILNCDSSDNITREHCSSALLHLASSYPPALSECNRPELDMRTTLTARAEVIATMDECKEEHEHVTGLLKLLNTNEDEDNNR